MDITQILITCAALVGIAVIALLAVIPTIIEFPAPRLKLQPPGRRHHTGGSRSA